VRASTLLNRVLDLPGVRVTGVVIREGGGGVVVVTVAARARRRLMCPLCSFTTRRVYDTRVVESVWRGLDLGGRRCEIRMRRRRRLDCPTHGVHAQAVAFARPGSYFTRDFEDLVVWLATKTDKTTVAAFTRVAWRTVGAMCQRVAADAVDPARLEGLVDIGVDEISWRKHHKYLTLVSDHATSKIVWGAPGKDAATMGAFFAALPEGGGGAEGIEAVSMDLGPAYAKAVREHAPAAVICYDPFHVVKLATDALDEVRRQVWQSARTLPDREIAKKYKGARWALLKNPDTLTTDQADTLKGLRRNGGALWRAYQLKETLREVFAGDLEPGAVLELVARWCSRAQRSRIPAFVKAAATIRKHRHGITAAIERGLANGRHEGLNTKVRLIIRRAYGFHTPQAALALIMLTCGPANLELPYHT
jgi:transposase